MSSASICAGPGPDRIRSVAAREILDSRGQPTVEVEVRLSSGALGRAAVPSGASTGEHEAVELRDGDKARFFGKGVLRAVAHAQGELAKAVVGLDALRQDAVDEAMIRLDGTANKGRLGANAILGVSMAVSRAAAASRGEPLYRHLRDVFGIHSDEWVLPTPMLNVINGGRHADSGLDVQEFMIVPAGAATFRDALRLGAQTYQALKGLLTERKQSVAVGDEGGFAPRLAGHEEALDLVLEALRRCGASGAVSLALDVAASELHRDGRYRFGGQTLTSAQLSERYLRWADRYPIVSLEDPFGQDDWAAWKDFTARAGGRVRVVGDDLFATHIARLRRGIAEGAANAILIKLNQIGAVTETVQVALEARKAGFASIISHRSGETEDPYIADLSVALNAGAIKTGAPCRSERLAKYNQLLRIEGELGDKARYAGETALARARV